MLRLSSIRALFYRTSMMTILVVATLKQLHKGER